MTVHNDLKRAEIDNAVLKTLVAEFKRDMEGNPGLEYRHYGSIRPKRLYREETISHYGESRIRSAVDRLCARGEAVRARRGDVRWRCMEEREADAKQVAERNAINARMERVIKKLGDRGFYADFATIRDGGWVTISVAAAEQFAQLCIDYDVKGDWKPEPEEG